MYSSSQARVAAPVSPLFVAECIVLGALHFCPMQRFVLGGNNAGNHDLWVRGEERQQYCDSLDKLSAVLAVCLDAGIHVLPAEVGGVWIAPLW